MFGIWGYHLLYGFLGLPRYEKLYLNMPLNIPTHHSMLPISEVLQAEMKLNYQSHLWYWHKKGLGWSNSGLQAQELACTYITSHWGAQELIKVQLDRLQNISYVLASQVHTISFSSTCIYPWCCHWAHEPSTHFTSLQPFSTCCTSLSCAVFWVDAVFPGVFTLYLQREVPIFAVWLCCSMGAL